MPGHIDVDGGGRAVAHPRRSRVLRVDAFLCGALDAKAAARTVKRARVERRRDVRVRRRVAAIESPRERERAIGRRHFDARIVSEVTMRRLDFAYTDDGLHLTLAPKLVD